MESSLPTYCSLTQLIDWIHAYPPSSPRCAYLAKAGSRKCWMSHKISNQALSLVVEHLDKLTGCSCRWSETFPKSKFFQELATLHLCKNHKIHDSHAIEQWLNEFNTKKASIIAKLKEYYDIESDGTLTGESEDDTDNVDSSGNDKGESDDDQHVSGEDVSEEEEGVSVPSSQSSSPIRLLRRNLTIQEDDVAKDVTLLLKEPATKKSKNPGWIYLICPNNLPGKVKVGISFQPPQLKRLRDHEKCHHGFETLTTQLIPYVYRVEQLLLKEFSNKHYVLENPCQTCNTRHEELLDVDKATLLRCLDKWIDFVESCPYNKNGNLTDEAKGKLPRPALKSYLDCKPTRRRRYTITPKKKERSQDSRIVSSPSLKFKVPTSASRYSRVHEAELSHDDLCSAVEDLQLTPSKNKRTGR